jgi:transposase
MKRTWGHDMEERQAVVQKVHDAYALVRQLEERVRGLEARNVDYAAEMVDRLAALNERIAGLQAQFDAATEPDVPARAPRSIRAA